MPLEEKLLQVLQCLLGTSDRDLLPLYQTTQNLGDFNVDQMGRVQAF